MLSLFFNIITFICSNVFMKGKIVMSLKKIAKMVGVSPSTVSRVLNNSSYKCASEELKNQIWEAAKQINYVPNLSARNLKLGINKDNINPIKIDILLTRFSALETDLFFKELFRSIEEELLNKNCLLSNVFNIPDLELPSTQSLIHYSDGLIILGKCPENILLNLKKHYKYLIGIDRNPTNYEIDEIICNGETAAIIAIEYLISLGHSKIAYIGDCTNEARYIGYYKALINHHLNLDYSNIYPTNQTKQEGYTTMMNIFNKQNRPTAIFCANDVTAIGVLKAINENKRKKYNPSIISIDNIEAAQNCKPLLTTVNIPKNDMGKLAVNILLDRINNGHNEYIRVELPCKLIIRESCYIV